MSGGEGGFDRAAMLLITMIGVLAFLAMLILGAYAPDLRSGKNGGTHALSNSATGFSGLVRLAEATGRNPDIVRFERQFESENLAVVSPDRASASLSKILAQRGRRVTLIILPKWDTQSDPNIVGWVRARGLLPRTEPQGVLAPGWPLKVSRAKGKRATLSFVGPGGAPEIRFAAPPLIQTISGRGLQPIIVDRAGKIVLGKAEKQSLYVLADPDLLSNHGLADRGQAKSALALLDYLNSTGADGLLFDVTANGLGHSRSPLRLAFDPPFLAVTIALFVTLLLAGWQALVRFGAAQRSERGLAFGKAALVENGAGLIRKAGRETRLGARYLDVVRQRATTRLSWPPGLEPEVVDARLDALRPSDRFTRHGSAVATARSREDLLGAAQQLHDWIEELHE